VVLELCHLLDAQHLHQPYPQIGPREVRVLPVRHCRQADGNDNDNKDDGDDDDVDNDNVDNIDDDVKVDNDDVDDDGNFCLKFSSDKSLAKHTKSKHMGREGDEKIDAPKNIFFCEFCEYSSKYRGNIKKHKKIKQKENYDATSETSDFSINDAPEKSISEASEKSVVVVRSPPEECVIIDIDDDTDPETEDTDLIEKNPKVENLLNDWD
jgi:hypothetical protein